MSTIRVTTFFVAFVGATALCTAPQAWAQKKYAISQAPNATSQFVQEHIIDVDDVPGHQLRVYEIRNAYPQKDLALAGVTVKNLLSRGMSDLVSGSGSFTAYNVYTLDDGNKVRSRLTGTTQSDNAGGRKSAFVENFLGGTGKFRSIRGQMRGTSERAPGAKALTVETNGEYWLDE